MFEHSSQLPNIMELMRFLDLLYFFLTFSYISCIFIKMDTKYLNYLMPWCYSNKFPNEDKVPCMKGTLEARKKNTWAGDHARHGFLTKVLMRAPLMELNGTSMENVNNSILDELLICLISDDKIYPGHKGCLVEPNDCQWTLVNTPQGPLIRVGTCWLQY